jgi:hypothetical protein
MCHKRGLPVLLTRYAVAADKSSAPELSAPFDIHAGIGKILPAPGKGLEWVTEKWAKGLDDGRSGVTLPKSTGEYFSKGCYYTQRLLRPGYLYMFDEKKKKWRAFTISAAGHLMEFDLAFKRDTWSNAHPPLKEEMKAPCNPSKNDMLARCVTIPDAENATVVWFAFSDVAWTYDIYKKHDSDDQKYRARNMRKFDVKKWLGREEHEHICMVEEAEKHIAEFANINPIFKEGKDGAFGFCQHTAPFAKVGHLEDWPEMGLKCDPPIKTAHPDYATLEEIDKIKARKPGQSFTSPMQRLKQQCARATEGGSQKIQGMAAVLALHDPAGIAMDLAAMIDWRLQWFNEDQHRRRGRQIVIGGIIESIRKDVMYQAETQPLLDARHELSVIDGMIENGKKTGYDVQATLHASREFHQAAYDDALKMRNDPARRKKVRDGAWEKYAERYRPERVTKDIEDINAELVAFNAQTIDQIALTHNAWMRSVDLANYFECNFDPCSMESGRVYTALFTLCIGNMQQCAVGLNLLYQWFDGDVLDRTCLLLRAMAFNQDMRAKALAEAIGEIGDGSQYIDHDKKVFNWMSFYKDLAKRTGEAFGRAVDADVGLLAGVVSRCAVALAKRLQDHYKNLRINRVEKLPRALVNFAGMTRVPIVAIRAGESFKRQLARIRTPIYRIAKNHEIPFTRAQIKNEFAIFVGTLEKQGALDKLSPRTMFVVDAYEFDGFAPNIKTKADLHAAFAGSSHVMDKADVAAKRTEYHGKAVEKGVPKMGNAVFSVAAAVFNYFNYINTLEAFANDKTIQPLYKDEEFQKMVGAAINMAMAATDTVERVVVGLAGDTRLGGQVGRALKAFNAHWFIRGAGVFASLITVGWDIVHANEAKNNGQTGLLAAYGFSAFVGLAAIGVTIAGWYFTFVAASATASAATVTAATAALAALSGWGLILLAIYMITNLIIGWLLGDSLQQWLERCYYGTFQDHPNSDKYGPDAEIAAFKKLQAAAGSAPKEQPLTKAENAEVDYFLELAEEPEFSEEELGLAAA